MTYIIAVKKKEAVLFILYREFNKCHPNIYLTIEINPTKFLDTQVNTKNRKLETVKSTGKVQNYSCHGNRIYLNGINKAQLTDLHRSTRISTNFDKDFMFLSCYVRVSE